MSILQSLKNYEQKLYEKSKQENPPILPDSEVVSALYNMLNRKEQEINNKCVNERGV